MFYSSQSSRVLETTFIHIENGYIHSYIPKYLCQQSSISIKTSGKTKDRGEYCLTANINFSVDPFKKEFTI